MWRLLPALMMVTALLLVPAILSATTLHVPTEFPTIQEAIDAALDGDVVLVASGIYQENLDFLVKRITLESEFGPDDTVIDGSEWTDPYKRSTVRMGAEWPGSVLRGFTITGGAGTLVYYNSWGGGVIIGEVGSGRRATIEDCIISGNAAVCGGGVAVYQGSDGTISSTRIVENQASERGGGIWFNQTGMAWDVIGCLIAENLSYGRGGGIHIDMASAPTPRGPDIMGCTVFGNTATSGAGVFCNRFSGPDITNCIISHSQYGCGLEVESAYGSTGDPYLACCDIFGNDGGNWVGPIADQLGVDGNFSEDPLYCGSASATNPYQLYDNSPCLEGATGECGLIGAFGVGCAWTPVECVSWGRVKALYR